MHASSHSPCANDLRTTGARGWSLRFMRVSTVSAHIDPNENITHHNVKHNFNKPSAPSVPSVAMPSMPLSLAANTQTSQMNANKQNGNNATLTVHVTVHKCNHRVMARPALTSEIHYIPTQHGERLNSIKSRSIGRTPFIDQLLTNAVTPICNQLAEGCRMQPVRLRHTPDARQLTFTMRK